SKQVLWTLIKLLPARLQERYCEYEVRRVIREARRNEERDNREFLDFLKGRTTSAEFKRQIARRFEDDDQRVLLAAVPGLRWYSWGRPLAVIPDEGGFSIGPEGWTRAPAAEMVDDGTPLSEAGARRAFSDELTAFGDPPPARR